MTVQDRLNELFKDKKSTWFQIHDSFQFTIVKDEEDLYEKVSIIFDEYWKSLLTANYVFEDVE